MAFDTAARDSRFSLDEPPSQPDQRSIPYSQLAGMDMSSPNGEIPPESDDPLGEMGSDPTVQAFKYLKGAEDNLTQLSALFPGLMPALQDMLMMLRQVVPQAIAAQMAGAPMSGPTGAADPMMMMAGMAGGMPPGGPMAGAPGVPPSGPPSPPSGPAAGGPPPQQMR